MAFFSVSECLQWMKTCLKIFPSKSSLAVQTLGQIIYHYLDQSSAKCSKLFLEISEIACETGQPPLSHPFRLCTAKCARCQIDTQAVAAR